MALGLLVAFSIFVAAYGDLIIDRSVCYGDLGCFKTADFRSLIRPIVLLPSDPSVISTRFYLYTRTNPTVHDEQEISYTDPTTIQKSNYNAKLPTKIIIHGFTHNAHEPWVLNMIKELLVEGDYNVIAVDWREGAKPLYTQATANSQVVGRQVSKLVKALLPNATDSAEQFHIIGHSLGAHIAGYAGDNLFRLGRITALDAASPYFEGGAESTRLDPRDAEFVDAIHTDGSGFFSSLGMGYGAPLGDVDFYPNGGASQPGCDHSSKISGTLTTFLSKGYSDAELKFACSHLRAIDYFTESINTACPYMGYPCKDNSTFGNGKCLECSTADSCSKMGLHADKSPARGSFYLLTQNSAPFCGNHYNVQVQAGKLSGNVKGKLDVTLYGSLDTIKVPAFENVVISSNEVNTQLLHTRIDIGNVTRTLVGFEKSSSFFDSFLYSGFYKLAGIDSFMGERQDHNVFCGKEVTIDNPPFRYLTPSVTKKC